MKERAWRSKSRPAGRKTGRNSPGDAGRTTAADEEDEEAGAVTSPVSKSVME